MDPGLSSRARAPAYITCPSTSPHYQAPLDRRNSKEEASPKFEGETSTGTNTNPPVTSAASATKKGSAVRSWLPCNVPAFLPGDRRSELMVGQRAHRRLRRRVVLAPQWRPPAAPGGAIGRCRQDAAATRAESVASVRQSAVPVVRVAGLQDSARRWRRPPPHLTSCRFSCLVLTPRFSMIATAGLFLGKI